MIQVERNVQIIVENKFHVVEEQVASLRNENSNVTENANRLVDVTQNSCIIFVGGRRSRSKSGCNRLAPAVYCKAASGDGGGKRKRSRSRKKEQDGDPEDAENLPVHARRRRKGRRRTRGRTRRRKGRKGRSKNKSARLEPKTANPFLNYLRVFRIRHCGWPASKIAIEGTKCCCKMNEIERKKFYREACAQRKRGKGRRGSKRRRRGGRRKGSRRGKSSKRKRGRQ